MCPGTYPEPFCLQGCPGQPRLVRPDAALHLTSLGSLFTPGCHLPSSCTHLNRPPAPMLSSLLTWAASGHICPRESESVLQEPQPWPSLGRMGLGLDDLSGPLGPEFYNCTYKSLLLNKMCRPSRVGSMPVGTFRVPPHIRTPRVGRQTHRIQAGLSRALYAEKLQGRQRSLCSPPGAGLGWALPLLRAGAQGGVGHPAHLCQGSQPWIICSLETSNVSLFSKHETIS